MPTPTSSNRLTAKAGKLPACDPCRAIKLRCDHDKPVCSRCRERGRGVDCTYRSRPFKRPSTRAADWRRQENDQAHHSRVTADETINPPAAFQYPNPGYLGSSSHTTFFDQLQIQKTAEVAPTTEINSHPNPADDYIFDDTCIAKGAELILELHRDSLIPQFTQLFRRWIATGTNLALAGPLTTPCASTTSHLISNFDGTHASATTISRRLFYNSRCPLHLNHDTTLDEYCANFCGPHARWETLGLFCTAVCRASIDLTYAEPMYGSEQQRRKIQKMTLSYSDQFLDLCLPLDCMNDLQLFLTYENFISHSQVDGDQSYLSWRKLGDVAAALFALGYHQQQTESFRAASAFLRDLRQAAFCRAYSADKNVSIFLGRPPRILRRFCHFYLPGDHDANSHEASRSPAVWLNTQKLDFAIDSRWAGLCAILKDDILDLFTEDNYDERARRAWLIEADIQAQWHAVPRSCRLECGLKACDRRPVERDFMVNMKLNYLHVQFLLRLALVRPMSTEPDSDLLDISLKMLGLVVETILLKDQIVNSGTSLVWKVAYYGLSAAGMICLTLVKRSFAIQSFTPSFSKIFQELSILAAEIERGTLVYIDSPNYALLARATQTIKAILDRMMMPSSDNTMVASDNRIEHPTASVQRETLDDGSWWLWDNTNLQEFELSFWHHLAGHPSLNQ
ncbi:Zn(II)2Cys6 transcription factor [Aspergillus vadensis CBS 113365]|uniref:Zn(2)-C6 fungal-type domain-containing protein n=1 Tax=Aspergillus vadensis (strain CBS 113365 / IMI 142717 / IBT 24658) TaxID=1448311 RepID=A0A319BGX8_ASPVC|nr:hypothetical protein BO88DRAFT_442356 [Aspergillus vadensis CBS 113365]PYH71887.1 hypothetical protein BO88DRAFT_442356 [Aspergillus vadensis CBS 113365]